MKHILDASCFQLLLTALLLCTSFSVAVPVGSTGSADIDIPEGSDRSRSGSDPANFIYPP